MKGRKDTLATKGTTERLRTGREIMIRETGNGVGWRVRGYKLLRVDVKGGRNLYDTEWTLRGLRKSYEQRKL